MGEVSLVPLTLWPWCNSSTTGCGPVRADATSAGHPIGDDMSYKEELDTTQNSTLYRRLKRQETSRKEGACSLCPPHGGENARKQPKADKYKSKRKGRC